MTSILSPLHFCPSVLNSDPTLLAISDSSCSSRVSDAPSASGRQRASMACNYCRRRKIKCQGDTPCRDCHKNNRECSYTPISAEVNKRTREKKALAKIAEGHTALAPSTLNHPQLPHQTTAEHNRSYDSSPIVIFPPVPMTSGSSFSPRSVSAPAGLRIGLPSGALYPTSAPNPDSATYQSQEYPTYWNSGASASPYMPAPEAQAHSPNLTTVKSRAPMMYYMPPIPVNPQNFGLSMKVGPPMKNQKSWYDNPNQPESISPYQPPLTHRFGTAEVEVVVPSFPGSAVLPSTPAFFSSTSTASAAYYTPSPLSQSALSQPSSPFEPIPITCFPQHPAQPMYQQYNMSSTPSPTFQSFPSRLEVQTMSDPYDSLITLAPGMEFLNSQQLDDLEPEMPQTCNLALSNQQSSAQVLSAQ